ncbi:MAG: HD domain-containing phosphohydrolase [Bacteriovoracaceae bacterium]
MQKYLLLVDREEDILEIQEAALKYFYGGEIVAAHSREEAIKALGMLGKPELIISDIHVLKDGLHQHLRDNGPYLPLIATTESSDRNLRSNDLSLVTSILTKPVCPEELSHLVKSFTQAPPESPTHVPIKLKVACEVASGKFDIYLKLSGTNYVKITHKGVQFSESEAEKLNSKGISEVYIKASESRELLRIWEEGLFLRLSRKNAVLDPLLPMECFEQVERISRAFDWSPEAVKASQKIVKDAITSLNRDDRISTLLKKKFMAKGSAYSNHVGLLCYLTCIMCAEMKMDEAQEKLVMAALMHDLSIDEHLYPAIEEWNKQARNFDERSPEVVRYRLHPLHSSQTAQTIDVLPPDVDQIILQHHEQPDGSGFPRGLSANRIHFLAAIFIIGEDLVQFLDDGESLETSLKDFLTWGEERYKSGNFKKIFDGIKPKID